MASLEKQQAPRGNSYQFKQSVHIRPKGKPGKNFHRGINQVPEEYEYDPYFLKLVAAGYVVEVDPTKMPAINKTSAEVAASLHEKLVLRKRGKQAPAMAARAALADKEAAAIAAKAAQPDDAASSPAPDDGEEEKSFHVDKKHKKAK